MFISSVHASLIPSTHAQETLTQGVVQNSWSTRASMPSGMSGLGVAVVNGKIYAFGYNVTYEYDPVRDKWAKKRAMPTPRTCFAVAAYQNKIYVIGGYVVGEWGRAVGINEVYDPSTDRWETRKPMPTPRAQLDANVVDGKIYLIGGRTGGPYSSVPINEVYDPATDSWTTKAPIPYPVVEYASAVVDGRIYVIGGRDEFLRDMEVNFNQIYDPETDTWSFGAPIPVAVWQTAAGATTGVFAPKRIYVIGGLPKGEMEGTNLNQVYNPENDTWTFGAPMPTPRLGLAVAVVDDVLYAIGGTWMALNPNSPIYAVNEQYIPIGYHGPPQPSPDNTPTPEPFPPLWVASAVAAAGISGAVLIVYFAKVKKKP